jgi:hypothetical protein
MKVKDALQLKPGDRVWVAYTPSPSHGKKINHPGRVEGCITGKDTDPYVWVCVHISAQFHASVFSSKFISKI